jgi:hypothetical protein
MALVNYATVLHWKRLPVVRSFGQIVLEIRKIFLMLVMVLYDDDDDDDDNNNSAILLCRPIEKIRSETEQNAHYT